MRRLLLLAVIAGLTIAATPVMAATTYHTRETGTGFNVYFSDAVFDAEGNFEPGSYFETWVNAAERVAVGDFAYEDAYVCVGHYEFSIDAEHNWTGQSEFSGCGPYDSLTITKKLTSGNVKASIPFQECLTLDPSSDECTEWGDPDTIEVDVTATGSGPLMNYHGTGSGGTAGQYQFTYRGNGSNRDASATGTVMLDGASLTAGATQTSGFLFKTKSGSVDVMHD